MKWYAVKITFLLTTPSTFLFLDPVVVAIVHIICILMKILYVYIIVCVYIHIFCEYVLIERNFP